MLHDFFHRPGEPDRGIVLNGGTILAARLEHRSSTDIDVKLTSDNALRDIMRDPQALARLDEALRNTGLERVRQRPPLQIVYSGHAGELDLFEGILAPPENVHWATIDGTPVAVASNRQIMTGKLVGRGARAPLRDIIDIAVSARADREACESALNATPYDVLATLPDERDATRRPRNAAHQGGAPAGRAAEPRSGAATRPASPMNRDGQLSRVAVLAGVRTTSAPPAAR